MKIKIVLSIIVLFLFLPIFSNICTAEKLDRPVHIKSIVPVSFVPTMNMTFKNFPIPNGTLYQSGHKREIFRNQLIVVDENVNVSDEFFEYILDSSISGMRRRQIFNVWLSLFHQQFAFKDAYYYPRWSFFFIGYLTPPYDKPTELFGIKDIPWLNFGQGFYYLNESEKTVVLWTTYDPETRTMDEVGNLIMNFINVTFPFYDLSYLENNYYLKNNFEYCENSIRNISSKSEKTLTEYTIELDKRISETMDRNSQYHTDFGYLCYNMDPLFFWNSVNAYGIFRPMIDELTEITDIAIKQNDRNIENLDQTKSIILNELNRRLQKSEIQRDYYLTFFSVFFSVLFGGLITLSVNIRLQHKERNTSNARQQRIEIYEPLYNEINKINKGLEKFVKTFNPKEISKAWENLPSGTKIRVPESLEDIMENFEKLGREYYNLYYDSSIILKEKINSVMRRYALRGIERRDIVDESSLTINKDFEHRKQHFFEEYQGDFFAGKIFTDIRRSSFEQMLSCLKHNYTKEHVFTSILATIDDEEKIISLKDTHERLVEHSKKLEQFLEGKIKYILKKYERKLKEI